MLLVGQYLLFAAFGFGWVYARKYSANPLYFIFITFNFNGGRIAMNVPQLQFLAVSTADLDWQKVGGNENPYNPTTQSESFIAYEKRWDQICFEYDEFRRGAP